MCTPQTRRSGPAAGILNSMKIRILGGGWYGCHIATALIGRGHQVELHEIADQIFAGASGGNPARLHLGFHYPRSRLTRAMCQDTHIEFMKRYGDMTRTIPVNVYAVAADSSLLDFGTYRQVFRNELDFIELERPHEIGLEHVEGAILTGERHILIHEARAYFEKALAGHLRLNCGPDESTDAFDWTVDCTFCACDAERIDRYEVCVTGLLEGPTDKAVTIMDGPFPSIYPWDPVRGLCSITSAKYTPIARFSSYAEAHARLLEVDESEAFDQVQLMRKQMALYWPASMHLYKQVGHRVRIRAMPLSGADARLVDVVRTGDRTLRIRAGKIDAIMHAERVISDAIQCLR